MRGKIDVVAAWSVDRLGRSLQDLGRVARTLQAIRAKLRPEPAREPTPAQALRAAALQQPPVAVIGQ